MKIKTIDNYDQVKEALRKICVAKVAIARATAGMNEEINAAKSSAAKKIAPLMEDIETLETLIEEFCKRNRADFVKPRSKVFMFGKISHKTSSEPVWDNEDISIAALEKAGHGECVKVSKSIIKEALKKLPENLLIKCGIRRVAKDNFKVTPDVKSFEKWLAENQGK